jgi:hypothetical protein
MYSSLDLSQDVLVLYDIRRISSIGILDCCSWKGLSGCVKFYLSLYVALIFLSEAWCLYSATYCVSSLWDSSLQKSHWHTECFQIDRILERSKASRMSCVFWGGGVCSVFAWLFLLGNFPIQLLSVQQRRHSEQYLWVGAFLGREECDDACTFVPGICWRMISRVQS